MNLKTLFDTQRILDARIEKEHPRVEGEDRLAKKILALQVELSELANEWRGFKFWSNDQEPRTFGLKLGRTSKENRYINPLLEEYVDCLHFILSIGLEVGERCFKYLKDHNYRSKDISEQFLHVFNYAVGLKEDDYCTELLNSFVYLGEMLGFTWEQIEEAYYEKNKINHERQNTGY